MNIGILVNRENRLDENYIPDDLVEYKEYNGEKIDPTVKTLIVKEVLDAFEIMNEDASKENMHFIVDSSYRSYEYQKKVMEHNIKNSGYEYASKVVAPPGASEHQTGLCVDVALNINGEYTDKFDDSFKEIKWLHENCYKYGFILRYPKGKEDITGYNYECWHIRYVGKEISEYMHDNNIDTLEEYYSLNFSR